MKVPANEPLSVSPAQPAIPCEDKQVTAVVRPLSWGVDSGSAARRRNADMGELGRTLPPCGHTNRETELTEIDVPNLLGHAVHVLVCTVPACREFCRAFVDLRDDPTSTLGDETDLGACAAE